MKNILGKSFFARPVVEVAPDMLGKYIVCSAGNHEVYSKIIEVEAYDGPYDLACHASKGRTKKTEVLWSDPGTLYVYLVYGMHWMLNVVTTAKDYPAAVLIRATVDAVGPGRVTKYFGINKSLHGKIATTRSGLWFEDRGELISKNHILRTPRIGVDYAGPVWAKKPYRFVLDTKNRLQ